MMPQGAWRGAAVCLLGWTLLACWPAGAVLAEPVDNSIRYCVDPDWAPFEVIDAQGQHRGIAADLLALVLQRSGIEMQLLVTRDWPESLAASRAGQCQVLSFLNQTPAREAWLAFTKPVLVDENVLITREEHPFVANLGGFGGETMALPKGTSVEERLRRDYPHLKIIITETESQAFEMVSDRRADMTMRPLIVAAYTIKHEGWFNLKIAGQLPGYSNQLRLGVVKDAVELRERLELGVQSITAVERQRIIDQHITITATTGIDQRLVYQLGGVLVLVLGTSLFWVRKLRRLNTELVKSKSLLQEAQSVARLGSYVIQVPSLRWSSSAIFDEIFGLDAVTQRQEADWVKIIHPDHRQQVLAHFRDALAGQVPRFDQVYRINRAQDQAERWIHGLGQVEFDGQGQPLRMIGTIQDVTAARLAELQLLQAKDTAMQTATQQRQFIRMLSHEVRTPLAVVDASAQVLALHLKDAPTQLALVQRIRRGSARLSYFFDTCLAVDRLEVADAALQRTAIDTEVFIRQIQQGAELLATGHRIEVDVQPELDPLWADPVLLQVLLINLLSNAIKYSPDDSRIVLSVERCDEDPGQCQIGIADEGPGIPQDELNSIFQKYQRGSNAESQPGAGLGLYLVRSIAQLHDGSVCAHNLAGKGTSVVVTIPFLPAAQSMH